MAVTLRVRNIEAVTEQLALGTAQPRIQMSLVLDGPAVDYALVWEWGRMDCEPGPKTVWGSNPDGETAVLTKTAPGGYIRVNRLRYGQYIREEVANAKLNKLKPSQWNGALKLALGRAAQRCARLIAQTAPIDSGELREEIANMAIMDSSGQPIHALDIVGLRKRLKI